MKVEEPVKILLVDDRPENLLALEVILSDKSYSLIKAASGKEALKILLNEQDFALILMDALMPVMDGFETVEMIRQSEKLKYIPIIFLSAQLNTTENIFKGYQAGAVDYMLKPLSAGILKAKVAVFVDLYRMNKEILAKETILKTKMNQLAQAQRIAHVGSWEWDIATGKIEWSDELFRIYGLTPQEFLADYEIFLRYVHPEDKEYVDKTIRQAYDDHKPFNFFHRLIRNDGEVRICNSIGNIITDEKGTIIKMTGTAQDVTEQKRAEEQTLRLIEDKSRAERIAMVAKEAAKSKQQFLANMSHEIRTPLNAIIGFTSVLLKTNLDEQQREYLDAIKVSGDSLIVLINDILDLAKVDAGKMTFEKIPFKLSNAISTMLLLFETKSKEANLELVKKYDESIPEVLVGDPVRLQQIILNLLSNAVKFTEQGKITLIVNLVKDDDESVTLEFSVTDTGIGIPENKIEKIFDNFQQATNKTNRLYGGTGLGLAIVKKLVLAQNGSLSVKSKVDEGSAFSFTLSFKKTKVKIEKEKESEIAFDEKIRSIKVLVAEDVILNQLLMKTVMRQFGFEMDIAANGKIAIEQLQKCTYDLILMDLQMPEMDGFETTDYIRNKMNLSIPIIALTADVTTVDLEKCRKVGMNDYITKPVDEKVLYSKIITYVKQNDQNKLEAAS